MNIYVYWLGRPPGGTERLGRCRTIEIVAPDRATADEIAADNAGSYYPWLRFLGDEPYTPRVVCEYAYGTIPLKMAHGGELPGVSIRGTP